MDVPRLVTEDRAALAWAHVSVNQAAECLWV